MATERFRVGKDDDGNSCIDSTNGTRIVFTSPDENESAVVAQRTAAMLNQHNRLQALELGHERSYSGYSTPPHSIGSNHVEDRPKLLVTAHQAETQAEMWDRYRDRLRNVLYPPDIVEIDAAPGIDHYNVASPPSFGRTYPRNARAIPQELREALLLATAYATENMQSYLDVANACRQELKDRYAAEEAAMHDQATARMGTELGEGA